MKAKLDQQVGEVLAGRFRHESRRSFMSRLTRGLFALAGVALPSVAEPYDVAAEQRAGDPPVNDDWEWCGLHGYRCEGDCAAQGAGNNGRIGNIADGHFGWVACCRSPRNQKWRCVEYIDYCGTRGPRNRANRGVTDSNCRGTAPSGNLWCGGVAGTYVCTMRRITATEFDSVGGCARGCFPQAEAVCESHD